MKSICFLLYSAARPLWCFSFFQQPLQSTQKTLHTQSESNASKSMPDLVCCWYLEAEAGEGEQALSSWWSWWVFVPPLSLQMQTVRRLQDVWAGPTKKKKIFFKARCMSKSLCVLCNAWICRRVCVCVCVPVEQEGCPSGVWGSVKLHHEGFASF